MLENQSEDTTEPDIDEQWLTKYPQIYENRRYAPRNMLVILKNLDTEISQYESMLIDEIEKRKKYKVKLSPCVIRIQNLILLVLVDTYFYIFSKQIDGCRRTHDYNDFICTFLSMMAEQGTVVELVEQQLILQKHPGVLSGKSARLKNSNPFIFCLKCKM